MSVSLTNLYSLINGYNDAKDRNKVFTFIEFIKEFGYDNSSDVILTFYRSYLTKWANIKKRKDYLDDKEFVKDALTDTLKSITLSYSSYEEQDFLANLDWENDYHKKAIIPFFAEKIKHICDFYRNKRQEVSLIVDKNKFKGTRKSIEEIIYEKIIDFYFGNRNQTPQIVELQENLNITLEEYVDTYSEYFNIPRNKPCTNASRKAMLDANLNNVNYSDYLEVNKVISEMIYSGEVYLEEIPLVAQVGLDLSAECAGDVEDLRQKLLTDATLNQIPLSEQVMLRRRLYQKLLGCNLYYIYADEDKNLQSNILVKADNPSGNLLNCDRADIALVESEQLELISHIGLFFKPDKLGILKIHADNFVWEVNTDKIKPDTFYVFPEPGKYGDIGNNKDTSYPLVYEYKLDSVIKNLSSGIAKDDPLGFISCTTWNTYYTKQDDDFKLFDNKNFEYSFTSLMNTGLITNYQQDMFGNEFALFKGFTINDDELIIPDKSSLPKISYIDERESNSNTIDILINGGYFVDPRYPSNNKRIGRKFIHEDRQRILNDYIWSGIITKPATFFTPDILAKHLTFGEIKNNVATSYKDHYKVSSSITFSEDINEDIVTNVFDTFITSISDSKKLITKKYTINELEKMPGLLCLKDKSKNTILNVAYNVKDFIVNGETIFIIKENELDIWRYVFSNNELQWVNISKLSFDADDVIKILYNENEDKFYILIMSPSNNNGRYYFDVNIYTYDPEKRILNLDNPYTFNHTKDNNFECHLSVNKLEKCSFSFNNNSGIYNISYIINDSNDIPSLYVHTFKLGTQSLFEKSLESICYNSVLPNNVYVWNEDLRAEGSSYTTINGQYTDTLQFFITDNQ